MIVQRIIKVRSFPAILLWMAGSAGCRLTGRRSLPGYFAITIIVSLTLSVPGMILAETSLSFNFLGDGLRDAADPYR